MSDHTVEGVTVRVSSHVRHHYSGREIERFAYALFTPGYGWWVSEYRYGSADGALKAARSDLLQRDAS